MRVGIGRMRTRRISMHMGRAALSLGSMLCGFTAVTLIPITEATALNFTAPLFSTIGAALILGETVRLRRWTAVLVGFAGTMVVLQPGVEGLSLGSILAIGHDVSMAEAILVVVRKGVGLGKNVTVRVDCGGGRFKIQKQTRITKQHI